MPLYNQQTNLSGRGNAPSVAYYAGIKAPKAPNVTLPKAEASFNIDLSRIGDAMIASSRDKKETELGLAKIQAAKEEKELQRQQKQLEIDTSNAYAQAIADIAAEVDQGRTDPLAANRKMRSVDDQFLALGYIDASKMASIRNSWDGGIGDYQKNTREQYRKAENDYKIEVIKNVRSKLPIANNWSNEQAYAYGIQKEYLANRARDSLNKFNMLPGEATRSIAVKDQQAVSNAQAESVILNSFGTNLSPSQMYQNVYTMAYNNAIANGWGEEEAADMANRALETSKPTIELLEKGTEKDKKYWEDKLSSETAKGKYMLLEEDRAGYMQTVLPNYNIVGERALRDAATGKLKYVDQPKREVGKFNDITIKNETDTSATTTTIPGGLNGIVTTNNGKTYVYSPDAVDINADNVISDEEWMTAVLNGQVSGGLFSRPKLNRTIQQCQGPECGRNGSYATASNENKQIINNNTAGMVNFAGNGNTQKTVKEQSNIDGVEYSLNPADLSAAAKAQDVFNNNPDLVELANDPKTKALSFRNASNQWVLTDEGRLMLSDTATTFGEGEVSRMFTNYGDMPQVQKINKAVQSLPYSTKVKKEIIRGMVSNNGKMIPDWNPEIHGDLRAEADTVEKIFGNISKGGNVAWQKVNSGVRTAGEYLTDAGVSFWDWYFETMKTPDEEGLTGEQKAKIAMGVLWNEAYKPMLKQVYDNLTGIFNKKEEEETSELPERDWDLQRGTVDIRGELPIHVSEDGDSWGNMRYGTITADGRTFVVPGFDEKGNISDPKTEFDKGRWFFSIAGDDDRSIAMAEGLGAKTRKHVIERDTPKAEKLMQQKKESKKSTQTAPVEGDNPNTFQKFLEENNIVKFKNPKTAEEKAVKQNLQNSVEIGKQIENISDAALAGAEGMAEEIKNLGINPEEAAVAITYIEDEAARDRWLEEYNRLGEMTYPDIRQMMFIGASITPAIFALGGKGAVKVSDYIDDFVGYLRNKSGTHLETNKEKRQREELEREDRIKEAFKKNQELFYNRYSTWKRFFTTGLYDDSGFETLDLEAVE